MSAMLNLICRLNNVCSIPPLKLFFFPLWLVVVFCISSILGTTLRLCKYAVPHKKIYPQVLASIDDYPTSSFPLYSYCLATIKKSFLLSHIYFFIYILSIWAHRFYFAKQVIIYHYHYYNAHIFSYLATRSIFKSSPVATRSSRLILYFSHFRPGSSLFSSDCFRNFEIKILILTCSLLLVWYCFWALTASGHTRKHIQS